MPKLSIITINYNNKAGLQQTMESVFAQTFNKYEYIIIDGGSTDGSRELIAQYKEKLSYWVSEKDKGVYNAMNKGIVKANGEYLLFLNSGDFLADPESLQYLFAKSDHEALIYGNMLVNELDGSKWVYKIPPVLTFGYFYRSSLPHQATLIKKELFEKTGLYNEQLKIAADWEFFVKAVCTHHCSYRYVDEVICVFQKGGISGQAANQELIYNERRQILEHSYPAFVKEYDEYFSAKAALNNYTNSRAHKLVNRLQAWSNKLKNKK